MKFIVENPVKGCWQFSVILEDGSTLHIIEQMTPEAQAFIENMEICVRNANRKNKPQKRIP